MRVVEKGKKAIEIPRAIRAKGPEAIEEYVAKKRGTVKEAGAGEGKVTTGKEA